MKMKQLFSILFVFAFCLTPCHAQISSLSRIYKSAKAAKQAQKARKEAQEELEKTKVKDLFKDVRVDTTSAEFKKAVAEAQQKMYESNPQLKRIMELQNDTAALRKYMEEQYGGMSTEEITRKAHECTSVDLDSKEYQDALAQSQKMSGLNNDPVFKNIMSEQRQLTMDEAIYLNEKYGTNFEYEGMEAFNDSVGAFAHMDGGIIPIGITKCESIIDERPVPNIGQNEIKQFIQNWLSILKEPFADREIVDSVQNYMVYDQAHADVKFKDIAKFTLYSNPVTNYQDLKVGDVLLRKIPYFTEPLDPKNIFLFKVHRGIGCRYMEYMYTKITYKESELTDYIRKRLVDEGYIDSNINQKMSDEQLFKAMAKMEFEFKIEKLLIIRRNNERFIYTNTIPAAKNVKLTFNERKVGGHVTALDVMIDAEPGEYAFVIRNPEVEQNNSNGNELNNIDVSVLTQGAFFFTIK